MLEKKLEEIKQNRNYSVQVWFGEDIGCDDLDVEMNDRRLIILASPVGYMGELKILWRGNLNLLKDFDFSTEKPLQIPNPPTSKHWEDNGYYIWGTNFAIKKFRVKTNDTQNK